MEACPLAGHRPALRAVAREEVAEGDPVVVGPELDLDVCPGRVAERQHSIVIPVAHLAPFAVDEGVGVFVRRGRAGGLKSETLVELGVTTDDAQRRGLEHGDPRARHGVLERALGSPVQAHGEHELATGRIDGPLIGEGGSGERGHGNEEQDKAQVGSHVGLPWSRPAASGLISRRATSEAHRS